MSRLGRVIRALDAGRLAGHHVLARWVLRTVEVLVVVAYGGGLVRSAWHRLAVAAAGAGGHARSLVIALGVLAFAAILLAERHHRHRQQRQQDSSTADRRAADPETERRHVSAISLTLIVGGIVLACAVTSVPIGPAILRAVVATALACGGAVRGWSLANGARARRPAWALAVGAARDDAPPGVGVPAVVASTFVVALAGALGGLPIGGLAVAIALLVATASRRDVGRRWAREELVWWRIVSAEVGAERVRSVTATRPQVEQVVWPEGVDWQAKRAIRKLAREYDDSGEAHDDGDEDPITRGAKSLRKEYRKRERWIDGTEPPAPPLAAFVAAIGERDARWGAQVKLTPDRVAGDADAAADRLAERLGLTWAVSVDASGLRISIVPTEPPSLPSKVAPDPIPDHLPILPTTPWFVGIDEGGMRIEVNLVDGAHLLIAGATRSGKSVCTYGLLAHVTAMGPSAQLYIGDPGDTTVAPWIPHAHMTTSDVDPRGAIELLKAVRAEMDRRKPLMRELRADKISEFGPDLPLVVVVIDEAAGWLRHKTKRLADEFRDHLLAIVSQGAKYGVRLCLILQRPTSLVLDTATRAQLSTRISFRVDDAQTGAMVFPELGANSTDLLGAAPGVGMIKSWGEVSGRWFRGPLHKDPWDLADQFPVRQQATSSPAPSPSPPAPLVAVVPAQPDSATVATAPGVPHAPGVPIVVRRPDGSVRRVVAQAPAPDGPAYGVVPRCRLTMGQAAAVAETPADLVGLVVAGADEVSAPIERAMARIRWARAHRLDAQAIVAGPHVATTETTIDERRVLAGVDRPSGTWASAMPLVLVDADFPEEETRPAGNLIWLRTTSDREFLASIAGVGLVDGFELVTAAEQERSDEGVASEEVPEEVSA